MGILHLYWEVIPRLCSYVCEGFLTVRLAKFLVIIIITYHGSCLVSMYLTDSLEIFSTFEGDNPFLILNIATARS